MVCHNDQGCTKHEEYERMLKELTSNSLGGEPEGNDNERNPLPKSKRGPQRVKRRLRCSPIKEDDANVVTEVSDGDADVVMIHSNPSDSSDSYKSGTTQLSAHVENASRIGMSYGKSKSKLNTQEASIPTSKLLQTSCRRNFRRPSAPQVLRPNPSNS